jgi:hypothetical protein
MAAPKLNDEQREALLTWLAAEYDTRLIRSWFTANGWPELARSAFAYYRKTYGKAIADLRVERRLRALDSGLALREERVARLVRHADELDQIKWVPDDKGRLWNEKAWRETLDDIAKEMGHRKQGVELTGKGGGPVDIGVKFIDYRAGLATTEGGSGEDSLPPGED